MNERASSSPTRTCVGCGSRDRQAAMIRLRRSDAVVVADDRVRTGRSAYVHARLQCLEGLVRSKLLGKSLRTTVAREARMELKQVLESRVASVAVADANGCAGSGLMRVVCPPNVNSGRK